MMKKTFLLGLGAVAGASFLLSKKVTEEQREKIALKLDEVLLDGREKALKYDRYLRDFLQANSLDFAPLKDKVLAKTDALKENEKMTDAITSLKQATTELRERLRVAKEELADEDLAEDMQDDIIIDGRSAFGEAKDVADFESEHPTEVFYPKKSTEVTD